MPQISVLNPTDQPTGKWRLIDALRASLRDPDFDTFKIAVAFAKTGPLYRLQPEIQKWREQKKSIEGIFGIDHCGTSRQALAFALDVFSKIQVLHFEGRFTYHPKMYLFSGAKRCRFFIGSHNLTVGGTETNWESGTQIDLALPEDQNTLTEANAAWHSLSSSSVGLTAVLLDYFDKKGKLLDEANLPCQKSGGSAAGLRLSAEVPLLPPGLVWPKLSIRPPSPLPKSLFAGQKLKTNPTLVPPRMEGGKGSPPSAEALVIQISPHHNGEVFLSKIAVNQNPAFFGYPFTGRTTPKKSTNPSYPQRTPDPIVNLTVHGNGEKPLVHLPRLALNTVFYETKAEIRITVPPEVVKKTPEFSILVMRQAAANAGYDYDFDIFPPTHPQFEDYIAVCNQTLPSGGKPEARKMGWL